MSDESDGSTDRRLTLDQTEADPTLSIDDAATCVTDYVADQTGRRPSENDVKAQLQDHHLPRFAYHGLVEYDEGSGEVRYHQHDQLEAFNTHVQAFNQR
jgi:hypothetical protein